jgi:hypothetical protein
VEYQLHEERAAVIRRIFHDAINGDGIFLIRKNLEAESVPCFGRTGRWTRSYIHQILRGREALGEYRPGKRTEDGKNVPAGQPIPHYYPAAVTEEQYADAQAGLRGRRNKGGRKGGHAGQPDSNLFTHLVYDAHDGSPMHSIPKPVNGKLYRYLTTVTRSSSVPYRDFERSMFVALANLKPGDVDGTYQADALAERVETLQAQRSALGLELDALDRQIKEMPPARWPTRVVARMADLEEQIKVKDEELRQAKEAANTSTRTQALTDLQTCLPLLDRVRGTPEEEAICRRIKARIPMLVESIWVRVQVVHQRGRYVHVRFYLHNGEPLDPKLYFCLPCGYTSGKEALPLANADFRAGEERGHAIRTQLRA